MSAWLKTFRRRTGWPGLALAGFLSGGAAAKGDILYLKSGGTVEGEILSRENGQVRVRTRAGALTFMQDAIERTEIKPTPFQEYERLLAETPDTPDGHMTLADWCERRRLSKEAAGHLRRVLELAPDHAEARRRLGYVRVGDLWVSGTAASAPATQPALTKEDEARLIAELQQQYTLRLRAIRTGLLESSISRLVNDGRAKVREITDPLAILPLTRILSEGGLACRQALVEALSRFPEDEATMNLALMIVTDNDAEIRRAALLAVSRRNDPRVVPLLREAIKSDNDVLIRRAAIALGELGAVSAVPELIGVLSDERRRLVETPIGQYFGIVQNAFGAPRDTVLNLSTHVSYQPVVGVAVPTVFGPTELQARNVTVMRTEVLEALKKITGRNFGFDESAWYRWLEEKTP